MIRPIDTQILHPQTPELANRQQHNNQLPSQQQDQFAHIMQKETESKKDTVIPTQKSEGLKTNKDTHKGSDNSSFEQNKKKKPTNKQATKEPVNKEKQNKFDIRI